MSTKNFFSLELKKYLQDSLKLENRAEVRERIKWLLYKYDDLIAEYR